MLSGLFSLIQKQKSQIQNSLDHPIRPRQHLLRNREANLLRCLEIDDELKLRRLLDRKISGLGAFENFVNIERSPLLKL